jgi:ABC-type transport system substrate-binding protein
VLRWKRSLFKVWLVIPLLSLLMVAVACGTGAPAELEPGVSPTPAPAAEVTPTRSAAAATPTVAPTSMPLPSSIVSARDHTTLGIPAEPMAVNPVMGEFGGGTTSALIRDNMAEPFTWHSGDDLRIVPTTATESWEQLAPDKWRFQLRKGVKFHNGEAWNAQAAMPSLEFQSSIANGSNSSRYTGDFKAEVTGEYTVEITCACPVLPRTTAFLLFSAPNFYSSSSEDELSRSVVSFGPYKQVEWESAVSFTQEAYDDYVPAGDHFEFQKPLIRNLTWVWRDEPAVLAAMVSTGEADIAWDVGVDARGVLKEDQLKSGTTAEIYFFWIDTIWHPELKKTKVRQAIAHAINCQELVDTLFGGIPPCIGNIIFPGVLGATERNTAPYKFDPTLARQLLEEANYDPKNLIQITGPAGRVPRQLETFEAIHGYLTDVGMNVEINLVEPSVNTNLANCRIGKAVEEVLEAQGKDPNKDQPIPADMQAAIDKGSANCPTAEFQNQGGYSVETLDFGKVAVDPLNCLRNRSGFCDPSPGGIQEQLGPALAATGVERQRRMEALADKVHDDVLLLGLFDIPIFYAVDSKLSWTPRFDQRVRVNTMWFSP